VSLGQLWQLALAWYADRISVDTRRPAPDAMVGIFARIGLIGPFWDPKSDAWGPGVDRPFPPGESP
jgi:hypothetical protein